MPAQISIQGCGIAASCCARLLQRKGLAVHFAPVMQHSGPTLLVNRSTQLLLAEVFDDGDLLKGLPSVSRRVVRWGKDPAIALPHAGVVVSERVLLERLWRKLEKRYSSDSCAPDFRIHSVAQTPNGTRLRFGSRQAAAVPVQIRETAVETCWIEGLDAGWLFLLPSGELRGTLLAIGGSPRELLEQSRLVGQEIASLQDTGAAFPASPQILDPLCGTDWLACGNAAMSFDPICGEGVGNAVREAILASAVIQSMMLEGSANEVLDHYASRLTAGFHRHLTICRDFYRAACTGAWWEAELAVLEEGIAWTQKRLSSASAPQYRLSGFDLEPLTGQATGYSSQARAQHTQWLRRS